MTAKTFLLIITVVLLFSVSCVTPNFRQNEIIYLNDEIIEEMINEFASNEKAAFKKYKNKIFQMSGEDFGYAWHRNASCVIFDTNNYAFEFNFNYLVHGRYISLHYYHFGKIHPELQKKHPDFDINKDSIEEGDKLILQGSFYKYFTIIDERQRKRDEEEGITYSKEYKVHCFIFKRPKIIGIMDKEGYTRGVM